MQMTPDGRRVLTGGADGAITLLDLQTSQARVLATGDYVLCLQMFSDGTRALSSSGRPEWAPPVGPTDNTIRLWDLETCTALRSLVGHDGPVYHIQTTPDERRALSASADRTLKLWDLETGECLRTFAGHTGIVAGIQITPDGRRAVSRSRDETVKLWDLETGECLRTFARHDRHSNCFQMTPDGRSVLSGFADGNLRLSDLETGVSRTFAGGQSVIICLQITSDGRRALVASMDGHLRLWDLETGQCLRTLTGHRGQLFSLLTPDGRRAFSGCDDGTIRHWDLETGECLQVLSGHDLRVIVEPSGALSGRLARPPSDGRDPVVPIPHVACLQITSDGTRVLSGNHQGTLKVWEIYPLPEERISAVARSCCFSADFALKAMASLPQFAQDDLRSLRERIVEPWGLKAVILQSLNIYNATQVALPDIRASLQRAVAEPIFLAESIRRVAYLHVPFRICIYSHLRQIKQNNGTLPQPAPTHSLELALLFERGSSIEERIEAITRTIEAFA